MTEVNQLDKTCYHHGFNLKAATMFKSTDNVVKELHSLRDILRWAITQFNYAEVYYGHGTDNAFDEALLLLKGILKLPDDALDHVMDAQLLTQEKQTLLSLIQQRCEERIPVAYLINQARFAGLDFYVDERVLVPRSPIAELIEGRFQPFLDPNQVERVLDLCAGSGCIGIACAYAFGDTDVVLGDISLDALAVAEHNIALHGAHYAVEAVESDLFQSIEGTFDLIVSNPPYVDAEDLADMPEEYHHEPAIGLGSGVDGLDISRQILQQAAHYLNPEGILVLEVGNSWVALQEQFPDVPFTWIDFQRGGDGVLVISREQLKEHFPSH